MLAIQNPGDYNFMKNLDIISLHFVSVALFDENLSRQFESASHIFIVINFFDKINNMYIH